jgi:hypothetical protein
MKRRGGEVRRWGALVFVAALSACTRGEPATTSPPEEPAVGKAATVSPGASVALRAPVPGASAASPRLSDPRWQRAAGEDPEGLQALADALGATGLLEALGDGGDVLRTGLLALPHADDAELALGPLARRALGGPDAEREAVLEAMLAIAGRPAASRGEPLDPEGAAEAGEALIQLAGRTSLPREQRALAVSAARALAEKRLVDASRIPTDLDPP